MWVPLVDQLGLLEAAHGAAVKENLSFLGREKLDLVVAPVLPINVDGFVVGKRVNLRFSHIPGRFLVLSVIETETGGSTWIVRVAFRTNVVPVALMSFLELSFVVEDEGYEGVKARGHGL